MNYFLKHEGDSNEKARWNGKTTYFILALVIYSLYIKFSTGEFNVVWLILLIGIIIFTSIQTYFKFITRN